MRGGLKMWGANFFKAFFGEETKGFTNNDYLNL